MRKIALLLAAALLNLSVVQVRADSPSVDIQKAIAPFRAVLPYRGDTRIVASSAIIIKKIQNENETILYFIVPPSSVLGDNDLIVGAATKYISVNHFEFAAETVGKICWSAETAIFKAVIPRHNSAYVEQAYRSIADSVSAVPSWQEGNKFPSANAGYHILGYDFPGEDWESVSINPVFQKVKYLGSDIDIVPPNQPMRRPIVLYKFKPENVAQTSTAGNVVIDDSGAVVAVVLYDAKSSPLAGKNPRTDYVVAVPSASVMECARGFFKNENIPYP